MTPVYIYGAGQMGRQLLARYRAQGVEPRAFIDRQAGRLADVEGVPVIAPDASVPERDARVVMALHSPGVNVAQVRETLSRTFADVTSLWAECRDTHWLPDMPFWLDPHFDWDAHAADIARARAQLIDDDSRDVFDRQLALRRTGDYAALSAPTPEDQYVPAGLPRWRDPMTLLDVGAYDGDTIRVLQKAGYAIEGLLALEPDPANFERLDSAFGGPASVRLEMAGAASFEGRVSFNAGTGTSARVDADGTCEIRVMRLDDLCDNFHPTLLKMDIEGAERDALEGALETIARDRPDLALSVYHRVHDLWSLMLFVGDRVPGYRWAMRSHAWNGFETVLYGYADR